MAIPWLPSYVQLQLDSYSEKVDYGVIRSEMDGLAKQRPRWSTPIRTRGVKLFVGGLANKLHFDGFIRNDLSGGSGWFYFNDPVNGPGQQGRFVSGSMSWSTPGRVWFCTAQIESIG